MGVAARENTAQVLKRLERWSRDGDWVGPDPYEGLNAPIAVLARGKRPRQALVQLYKRLPVAPAWPLNAAQRANAKVLGLALSGYSTAAGQRLPAAEQTTRRLLGELELMRVGREGVAWGYHFDVQTRHLFYGHEEPNAIATCFVVAGLCDAHESDGGERAAAMALAARPFLLSLYRESSSFGPFFTYVAAGSELIHNANLMVCGTLSRLHRLESDPAAEQAVRAAAQTTLTRQRDNGLWAYGEAANLGWQDNFHTAYTLEGLLLTEAAFGVGGEALTGGIRAWLDAFFEADGWARYFPDRHFPLEPHCCASAIDLLCLLGDRCPDSVETAERIAARAIRELWIESEGRFAFRRTAKGLNRRTFMRWTNAPMFRALARLESAST